MKFRIMMIITLKSILDTYRCQIWGWAGDAFWQLLLQLCIQRSSLRWKQLLILSPLLKSTINSFKSMLLLWTYDWLLVKNWLNINVLKVAHLFSLLNDCLLYDKLWGPSQRVVTLLHCFSLVCVVSQGTAWYCMVLRGSEWYYTVLQGIAW